jgi:hypothetical protein
MKRSWKLDTSTTIRSGVDPTRSVRAVPILPAAAAPTPDASSIPAIRVVTVVFPFVPVTATIGAVR